jgi:endonuclease YncB( thermonuclease family)
MPSPLPTSPQFAATIADVIARCPASLEALSAPAPLFSLAGRTLPARVHRIYDGDSCYVTVAMDDTAVPVTFKARLNGIDTPELRGASAAEKACGIIARNRLRELLPETLIVCAVCGTWDKYGRVLVDLYLADGTSVNRLLVAEGLAVPYDGGRRTPWAERAKCE